MLESRSDNIKTSNLFISVPSHSLDSQINMIYIRVLQCLSYMENHWVFFLFFFILKGVSLRLVWWFFTKNKTHYIHDLYALMKLKRNMREIFVCVLFFSTSHTKRIIIIYPNEPLLYLYKHIHPFMKCHSTLDSGNIAKCCDPSSRVTLFHQESHSLMVWNLIKNNKLENLFFFHVLI